VETKTYIDKIIDFTWKYGPTVVISLLLLLGGWWLINRFVKGFDSFLKKRQVDPTLRPFFITMTDLALKAVLVLMVAGNIGLQTTSFIAAFTAIAFSVGLALQGSLGNFASGVLILLFRPYKVGDLINAAGKTGWVREIQIFNTILMTNSGKKIIVPNGKMTEGPIENIAEAANVQVELHLLVDSETPLPLLRSVTDAVVAKCPWATTGRPATVLINGITRDDMKVEIACWTLGEHYENTQDYLYEALKNAFETAGIRLAKERRREML
jgi:small conductance mechanosensitive channel